MKDKEPEKRQKWKEKHEKQWTIFEEEQNNSSVFSVVNLLLYVSFNTYFCIGKSRN